MKIKIEINDELKTFETLKLRGRAFRRLLEVQDILEDANAKGTFSTGHFDLMMEFIVECFGNKFTTEELLDGVELEDINLHFQTLAEEINEKSTKKMKNIAKN